MPVPVINPTTSVLEFRKHERWSFQPAAVPAATYWNITGLPNGMGYNFALGKISGAAEEAGPFNVTLIAGNDSGVSEPMVICVGISGGGIASPSNEVDVTIDLQRRQVVIGDTASMTDPILFIKSNDKMRFRIRFTKGGVVADLDIENLYLSLKADAEEENLVTASTFAKEGSGEDTSYVLYVDISGPALAGAIEDHAVQAATPDNTIPRSQFCNLLSEFEWVVTHPTGIGGIDTTRVSSLTFYTQLTSELHANS